MILKQEFLLFTYSIYIILKWVYNIIEPSSTSILVQKIKSLGIYNVYVSGQSSEAHGITKYAKRLSIGNINN